MVGKRKGTLAYRLWVFHYVSFVPAGFCTRQPLAGIPHELYGYGCTRIGLEQAGTDTRFAFGGIFDLAQWCMLE